MTPEQIAREAALALVGPPETQTPGVATHWRLAGWHVPAADRDCALRAVEIAKKDLAAAVLAAVERALREAPVPGALSPGRLAQIEVIRDVLDETDGGRVLVSGQAEEVAAALDDLLAHAGHLARVLQDCAADGLLARRQDTIDAAFRAGFAAGAEEQREWCRAALDRLYDRRMTGTAGRDHALGAVANAPLAEPPA